MYKEGQRILERQRFQFPTTWLYSDNIEGEWGAFSDIIKRKDQSIQTQVASLQMKIVSEDKVVESKTTDMLTEWEHEKPVEVISNVIHSREKYSYNFPSFNYYCLHFGCKEGQISTDGSLIQYWRAEDD